MRFEFDACKILSGSINIYRSYPRKANFEQIHITLSCICMTCCHAYAWQHTITDWMSIQLEEYNGWWQL